MTRTVLVAALVATAGCESAAERCARIPTDEQMARLGASIEERLSIEAHDTLVRAGLDPTVGGRWDSVKKALRQRRTGDSLPRVTPPPRPSDLAWYGEHCWDGEPR